MESTTINSDDRTSQSARISAYPVSVFTQFDVEIRNFAHDDSPYWGEEIFSGRTQAAACRCLRARRIGNHGNLAERAGSLFDGRRDHDLSQSMYHCHRCNLLAGGRPVSSQHFGP